jgi:hypothetical protein
VVASIMSFSDLLAFTNQLSEPEPSPPPDPKQELDGLKASLEELKVVQEAQGIQISKLLDSMTTSARHAVRTPLRANSYFEPLSGIFKLKVYNSNCYRTWARQWHGALTSLWTSKQSCATNMTCISLNRVRYFIVLR